MMLPEDLTMMVDQVRRLLDAETSFARQKQLLERPGSFDHALWAKAVEMGWPGLAINETAGGLGLGITALTRLLVETGQRTVSLPLVPGHVTATALSEQGVEPAVARSLAVGDAIATIAFCEAGDASLTPRTIFRDGSLHGSKAPAPFASVANHALVSACNGDLAGVYLVALDAPQVSRADVPALDNTRAVATLQFDGAPAILVASGQDMVLRYAAIAAMLTAFEQVGGSERCLNISVAYAKERRVFGQPIGAFQAIKHKLADIYQELEIARGCAIDAAEAIEAGSSNFLMLACTARLAGGIAYDFAARECIQTHGGIGVTWEAEPQHHYRRARSLALELGGAAFWRDLLVDGYEVLESA